MQTDLRRQKPVGKKYLLHLLDGVDLDSGQIKLQSASIQWSPDSLVLQSGDESLTLGPGDGELAVLQLSRSASLGEKGFFDRILSRPRPVCRWFNVRIRARGLAPIYLKSMLPEDESLVGVPVLPTLAQKVDWGDLLSLLALCNEIQIRVASWNWDDTVELTVAENPLAELETLLEEPSTAHWIMLCRWYDALETEEAVSVLAKLRGELAHWPDELRTVQPTLEPLIIRDLLQRGHSHLDISRVLQVTPLDSENLHWDDLSSLAAAPLAGEELTELVIYDTGKRLRGSSYAVLSAQGVLPSLQVVELHDLELGDADERFTPWLAGPGMRRMRKLAFCNCDFGWSHLSALVNAAREGQLSNLECLVLSDNEFKDLNGLRDVLGEGRLPSLRELRIQRCQIRLHDALEFLESNAVRQVPEVHLGILLYGRLLELVLENGERPLHLDLSGRGLGAENRSDEFRWILESSFFQNLVSLDLSHNELGESRLTQLVQKGRFDRLRRLDLSHNSMTTEALQKLVHWEVIEHLEELDLSSVVMANASGHEIARGKRLLAELEARLPQLELHRPPALFR